MAATLGTLTLDLIARVSEFNRNMQSATRTVETASMQMSKAAKSASETIRYLLAISGTYMSVTGLVAAADAYTEIANRIRLVSKTQAEFNTAIADTFKISQETRQSWEQTTQIYQRFMQMSDELGLSQARIASVVDTVGKAVAISGSSAQSAQAALMQLGQAIGSGVLRGEEFNSVAEQAVGLLQALASGLGVATSELRTMANNGKLTGDVLIKALENSKESVDALFKTSIPTIAQSFVVFSNALKKYVGEASTANGASAAFSKTVITLSENLEQIANVGLAVAVGYFTKAVTASTIATAQNVKATLTKIQADRADAVQNKINAEQEVRKAFAEKNAAQARVSRARATVTAIEMEVAAERSRLTQQIASERSSLALIQAERVRISTLITLSTQTQTQIALSTRFAQVRQAEAVTVNAISSAEARLAATNLTTSRAYSVAIKERAAATAQLTVATSALNVAQAALVRTTTLLTTAMRGLLAFFGGPLGLALTAATVAYFYFSSKVEETTQSLASQSESVKDLTEQYKALTLAKLLSEQGKLRKELDESKASLTEYIDEWDKYNKKIEGSIGTTITILADSVKRGGSSADAISKLSRTQGVTAEQLTKFGEMASKLDDVNAKIKHQRELLGMLSSMQKDAIKVTDEQNNSLSVLTATVKAQLRIYENRKVAFKEQLEYQIALAKSHGESAEKLKELTDITEKFSNGTLTASQTVTTFSKAAKLNPSVTASLGDYAQRLEASKKELVTAKDALIKLNTEMDNGKKATDAHTQSMSKGAEVAANYAKQIKSLSETVKQSTGSSLYQAALIGKHGFSPDLAKKYAEARKELGLKVGEPLPSEVKQMLKAQQGAEDKLSKLTSPKSTPRSKVDNTQREADERKQIMMSLADTETRLNMQLADEIYRIRSAGFGAETDKYIELVQKQYAVEALEADKANTLRWNELTLSEKSRLDYVYNIDKQIIAKRTDLSNTERAIENQVLDAKYAYEVNLLTLTMNKRLFDSKQAMMSEIEVMQERYRLEREEIALTLGMSDDEKQRLLKNKDIAHYNELIEKAKEYRNQVVDIRNASSDYLQQRNNPKLAAWNDLQTNYDASSRGLDQGYIQQSKFIRATNFSEDAAENERLRNQALLDAHSDYLEARQLLDDEYAGREQDLRQKQVDDTLNAYSSVLSSAQSTWGNLTSVVKDAYGEQSSAYKAMFLVQQAMAIGTATINAFQAYGNALAMIPPPANIPIANVMLGLGMANVGLIAGQTIAGMAHSGIDNIPKEGTWLLDKGERVLSPQQNQDFTRYMANGGSGDIKVNVIVNSDSSSSTDVQGDSKKLGEMLANAVRQVIIKEKRQGGLLT